MLLGVVAVTLRGGFVQDEVVDLDPQQEAGTGLWERGGQLRKRQEKDGQEQQGDDVEGDLQAEEVAVLHSGPVGHYRIRREVFLGDVYRKALGKRGRWGTVEDQDQGEEHQEPGGDDEREEVAVISCEIASSEGKAVSFDLFPTQLLIQGQWWS